MSDISGGVPPKKPKTSEISPEPRVSGIPQAPLVITQQKSSVMIDELKRGFAKRVVAIIAVIILIVAAYFIVPIIFRMIGDKISGAFSALNPFKSLSGSKPLKVKGPLSACPAGKEKDGALCYDKCPSGYDGVGPVCWQICPKGFRNDGAFCGKPKSYGRGAGYITKSKCENKAGSGKCEKNGLIWYPKCKAGFHNVGCCVCSPDCPDNFGTDIGVSCTKKTKTRGAGTPLVCPKGQIKVGGLCYEDCAAGYKRKDLLCLKDPNAPPPPPEANKKSGLLGLGILFL